MVSGFDSCGNCIRVVPRCEGLHGHQRKDGTMKRISSEKCNVAWFRLAECVSRGEQEKAFGVYRLLSHSLDDQALVQQLAGDLFLSFNDEQMALEKYERAADLYQRAGHVHSAVSVYDHMLTIDPSLHVHRPYLARLHERLGALQKKGKEGRKGKGTHATTSTPFESLLTASDWEGAANHAGAAPQAEQPGLYRSLIVAMVSKDAALAEQARPYVTVVLDTLLSSEEDTQVQQFFAELKAVSKECYRYARDYAKKEKK